MITYMISLKVNNKASSARERRGDKMKWISVRERLPETKQHEDWFKSDTVLVLVSGITVTAHYEHGQFEGEPEWSQWWDHWCSDEIEAGITHWMPEPPKP